MTRTGAEHSVKCSGAHGKRMRWLAVRKYTWNPSDSHHASESVVNRTQSTIQATDTLDTVKFLLHVCPVVLLWAPAGAALQASDRGDRIFPQWMFWWRWVKPEHPRLAGGEQANSTGSTTPWNSSLAVELRCKPLVRFLWLQWLIKGNHFCFNVLFSLSGKISPI